MAFAPFTGKSGGTTFNVDAAAMPGWRTITVEENGRPLPTPLDITDAGDSAYTFVDDPLGGKGDESCTITVEGFLSVTDHQDTGGWLALAIGTAYTLTVTTKASGDEWTLAACVFKSFNTDVAVAGVVPFTATFAHATSPGAWSTDAP